MQPLQCVQLEVALEEERIEQPRFALLLLALALLPLLRPRAIALQLAQGGA